MKIEMKTIKDALREHAPNMRFTIDFTRPVFKGANIFRSVTITYNATIGKERGLNRTVLTHAVRDALNELPHTHVRHVTVKPVEVPQPKVNQEKVNNLADVLTTLLAQGATVPEVLAHIATTVNRTDRAFLNAVASRMEESVNAH